MKIEFGKLKSHHVSGCLLFVVGLVGFALALAYPIGTSAAPGPAYFPIITSVVLSLFGAVLAWSGESPALSIGTFWERGRPAAMLGALIVATLVIEQIGFRLTIMGFLLFFLIVVERCNVLLSIAIAVLLPIGTFALLTNVLKVSLPVGPLGF